MLYDIFKTNINNANLSYHTALYHTISFNSLHSAISLMPDVKFDVFFFNLVNHASHFCKILRIQNLCLFFLWPWWLQSYWQFCDFSLNKSSKIYPVTVLPDSTNWHLVFQI
jgi:hypothetical protein